MSADEFSDWQRKWIESWSEQPSAGTWERVSENHYKHVPDAEIVKAFDRAIDAAPAAYRACVFGIYDLGRWDRRTDSDNEFLAAVGINTKENGQ